MNDILTQIADRANQLKATDLAAIKTTLEDSIAGLRIVAKDKMTALTAAGHESPNFGTLAVEVGDLAVTIETLVKAAADVTKLSASATKALDRVQKRLARYAKPAA